MICALAIGREGSRGFPGKNVVPVLGRPLMAYPLMAAAAAKQVDRVYLSTDSARMKAIGIDYGARIIDRPAHLATHEALGEEAFVHGYQVIRDRLAEAGETVELMILLFANAPTVTGELIDQGIAFLRSDPTLDSAVTVSRYNMWSPLRARRLGSDGCLHPFVELERLGHPGSLNCDRDSQGDVYFADMGVSVVRPRCLESLEEGLLPQRWMGRRIFPIHSEAGCDVDYPWQIPGVERWLLDHGVQPAKEPALHAKLV